MGPGTFRATDQQACGTKMTQLSQHWWEMTGQEWTPRNVSVCLPLFPVSGPFVSCFGKAFTICMQRIYQSGSIPLAASFSRRFPSSFLFSACLMCKHTPLASTDWPGSTMETQQSLQACDVHHCKHATRLNCLPKYSKKSLLKDWTGQMWNLSYVCGQTTLTHTVHKPLYCNLSARMNHCLYTCSPQNWSKSPGTKP